MRTTGWITLYSGLLIGTGYFVGAYVRAQWTGSADDAKGAAAEAGAALLWAYVAYRLINWAAPGTSQFREFSAVGILSPRALTIWEAVALWSGLAVVLGLVVPFDRRFRLGGTGLAASGALLLVFSPFTFFVSLFSWFGSQWRLAPRSAVLLMLFVALAVEWLLSMLSASVTPQAWGLVHGPESTLWVAALGGVLAARQSHETGSPTSAQ